jgi:hypothetical protein
MALNDSHKSSDDERKPFVALGRHRLNHRARPCISSRTWVWLIFSSGFLCSAAIFFRYHYAQHNSTSKITPATEDPKTLDVYLGVIDPQTESPKQASENEDDGVLGKSKGQPEIQSSAKKETENANVIESEKLKHQNKKKKTKKYPFSCNDDRVENNRRLLPGEYICSSNGLYQFGLLPVERDSTKVSFAWRDLKGNVTKSYIKKSDQVNKNDIYGWVLTENAEMIVYDAQKKTLWNRKCQRPVEFSPKCLNRYNCPYIHIHNDGVVVLNWIDGFWNSKNVKKIYDF